MEKSDNLAVLILAAGSSSRLGKPKQLLKIKDESLIQIAVKKALNISSDVKVVLGHKSDEIIQEIKDFAISIAINPNYEQGMGSSISFGMKDFIHSKKVLIMLCDQPLIPLSHYNSLIRKSKENENLIICSKYQNRFAVPSIFPNTYYKALADLKGDEGARKLLKNNLIDFVILDDKLSIDIDTKEDFENLDLSLFTN
jgi:molybdenum cofactor cytidylyltransferase